MMKFMFSHRIKCFLLSALCCLCVSSINAQTKVLEPIKYELNAQYSPVSKQYNKVVLCQLLNTIFVYFDCQVGVNDNIKAYIESDGHQYGNYARLSAAGKMVTGGAGIVIFDSKMALPRDRTYHLVISAGAFFDKEDPNRTTQELSYEFYVPEKITEFTTSSMVYDEATDSYVDIPLDRDDTYQFMTDVEFSTDDVTNEAVLYRYDCPIMNCKVNAGWDYNFGFIDILFGRYLNFEQDVNYTIVLPQNSVSAKTRSDMKNAEFRKTFIGNCGRTFNKIAYSWCSASDKRIERLGTVNLRYNTSIALAPNARLQLCEPNGVVLKEATASLNRQTDGSYMLAADFGGVDVSGNNYVLCVPEATVVGTGADITINERNLIPLNGYVLSVDGVNVSRPSITLAGSTLHITALQQGDRISVCTSDGTQLTSATAAGSNFTTILPQKGLYIVRVNGWATKVAAMK